MGILVQAASVGSLTFSFFLSMSIAFNPLRGNSRRLNFCFPQYFGTTRRNMKCFFFFMASFRSRKPEPPLDPGVLRWCTHLNMSLCVCVFGCVPNFCQIFFCPPLKAQMSVKIQLDIGFPLLRRLI